MAHTPSLIRQLCWLWSYPKSCTRSEVCITLLHMLRGEELSSSHMCGKSHVSQHLTDSFCSWLSARLHSKTLRRGHWQGRLCHLQMNEVFATSKQKTNQKMNRDWCGWLSLCTHDKTSLSFLIGNGFRPNPWHGKGSMFHLTPKARR